MVVIPGDVIMEPGLLQKLMEDICLLHGLGVRLVVVLGAAPQIDAALDEAGGVVRLYVLYCSCCLSAAVHNAACWGNCQQQWHRLQWVLQDVALMQHGTSMGATCMWLQLSLYGLVVLFIARIPSEVAHVAGSAAILCTAHGFS